MFNWFKKRTAFFWLATLWAGGSLYDTLLKPIIALNIERWAESKNLDNELVDGGREAMPWIDWAVISFLEILGYVSDAIASQWFFGFICGALVFAFWDVAARLVRPRIPSIEAQAVPAVTEDTSYQKLRDENAPLNLAPPPQQPDPRLDASVRKQNLETFLRAFDATISQISRYYDTMMKGFVTLPDRLASAGRSDLPSVRRGPLTEQLTEIREFDMALGELTSLHKQFFAEDVHFGDQSSYTSKPYRPAPDEPEGLDEEMRHEYRRAYARNQALKTEEPAVRKRILAEIRECDHKLGLIAV